MNLNQIKIQPIESAAKKYAQNIVDGWMKFDPTTDVDDAKEIAEVCATDFENGAEWVLDLFVKRLNFTTDRSALWDLVHELRGEKDEG